MGPDLALFNVYRNDNGLRPHFIRDFTNQIGALNGRRPNDYLVRSVSEQEFGIVNRPNPTTNRQWHKAARRQFLDQGQVRASVLCGSGNIKHQKLVHPSGFKDANGLCSNSYRPPGIVPLALDQLTATDQNGRNYAASEHPENLSAIAFNSGSVIPIRHKT